MKVAVISGKGGSGKSSVTAALIALSENVVAVDCDVDASNLPLLFSHQVISQEKFSSGEEIVVDTSRCIGCGKCVQKCAFGALELRMDGKVHTKEYLCEGCALCVRICPRRALQMVPEERSILFTSTFHYGTMVHGRLCPGDDNSGKMIARLRAIADQLMTEQQVGLQILDGPPGIGCPVLSTVTGVDRVVIVAEPSLSGISDLKRVHAVAQSFCSDIMVVINKCDMDKANLQAIHGFCEQNRLPVVAELPFERKWVDAQMHCQTLVTYAPECESTKVLKKAYAQIIQ